MHTPNAVNYAVLVVLYKPTTTALAFWQSVSLSHPLIVIDNSPKALSNEESLVTQCHYYHNNNQGGIAGALNYGLNHASQNYQWCFLFDQDSRPNNDYFATMPKKISAHNEDKLALCAPVYWEQNRNYLADIIEVKTGKVVRHSYRTIRHLPSVNTSYTITSGSAIHTQHWLAIGQYDESLFLDFVDIDWGLKATHLGYQILTFPDVIMKHTLGDTPIQFGKVAFVCHSPERHYLYFRNVVMMLKRPHVPWAWKKMELIKLMPRFFVYALLTKQRHKHIRAMSVGLFHGILTLKN
jgi:rhamnosyltransferase